MVLPLKRSPDQCILGYYWVCWLLLQLFGMHSWVNSFNAAPKYHISLTLGQPLPLPVLLFFNPCSAPSLRQGSSVSSLLCHTFVLISYFFFSCLKPSVPPLSLGSRRKVVQLVIMLRILSASLRPWHFGSTMGFSSNDYASGCRRAH